MKDEEYIIVHDSAQMSGYSRGRIDVTLYYDKETGELVDWETDTGSYEVVRSDMEVDTDDFKQSIEISKGDK